MTLGLGNIWLHIISCVLFTLINYNTVFRLSLLPIHLPVSGYRNQPSRRISSGWVQSNPKRINVGTVNGGFFFSTQPTNGSRPDLFSFLRYATRITKSVAITSRTIESSRLPSRWWTPIWTSGLRDARGLVHLIINFQSGSISMQQQRKIKQEIQAG